MASIFKEEAQPEASLAKEKEPQSARDAYTKCIAEINQFQMLIEEYHQLLRREEIDPLALATLKCALMQSICLIGDTLTWLRPGVFGRDFEGMPPELNEMARQFDGRAINHIIKLRNIYPHKFLYDPYAVQFEKFELLFSRDTLRALSNIQETMAQQLERELHDNDYNFVGQFRTGNNDLSIDECCSTAVREVALLSELLANSEQLRETVNPAYLEKAIDGCIKNICQIYKDYKDQLAHLGESEFAERIKLAQNEMLAKASEGIAEAFALLEDNKILRDCLAHPNMQKDTLIAKQLREAFIKNFPAIRDLLINIHDIQDKAQHGRSYLPAIYYLGTIDEFYKKPPAPPKAKRKVSLPNPFEGSSSAPKEILHEFDLESEKASTSSRPGKGVKRKLESDVGKGGEEKAEPKVSLVPYGDSDEEEESIDEGTKEKDTTEKPEEVTEREEDTAERSENATKERGPKKKLKT